MNKTNKLLKQLKHVAPSTPIATDMHLPNHSGDHSAGILKKTPTKEIDLVNKKYVDDTHVPAGSEGEIQFNESSKFQADSNLFWDNMNKRLGIGTTTPNAKLYVMGGIIGTAGVDSQDTLKVGELAGGGSTVQLRDNAGTLRSIFDYGNTATNNLEIKTGTTSGARSIFFTTEGNSRLWIDYSGKIGIGTDTPDTKLEVNGAISSATSTFSTEGPTDNVDVSGVNTLFINSSGSNITIGGFAGGVAGQYLHVVVKDATNNTILEHNEGGGSQNIFLHAGADETLTAEYGGWLLVCDGSNWFECGQGA